jgi:hypothetical protein
VGRGRRRGTRADGWSRLLGSSLAVLAIATGCDWGSSTREAIVVEASQREGTLRPIWDELNLWKLDGWFGVHRSDPADDWGDGWLRTHAPWVRYGRVVAVLGGNYAPEIADACDHRRATPEHPEVEWECGRDGQPGPAAQNEIARRTGAGWEMDYGRFRTSVGRVLRSGVLPHLNVSSSPSAFTGGEVDYGHYHWNAAPVTDVDGWLGFARDAFASLAELHPKGWRVSIVNEPNCLIRDGEGPVRSVGFAGGAASYAHLWKATALAIREVAPDVDIHPGNYVTSATFPGEDNLAEYLTALAAELAREPKLAWEDLPYVSLSLYEVPDTELLDFRTTRIARLYGAQEKSGLRPLPVKLDELGIHANVRRPFEKRTGEQIRRTLYAASWHAEALRSFLDAGDVVSVSPWLEQLFVLPEWRALPSAQVYWLFGMLIGQLRLVAGPGGDQTVAATGDDLGRERLAVQEQLVEREPPPDPDSAEKAEPRSSLRALAVTDDDVVRVLIVHHQNEPVLDDDPVRQRLARRIDLELRGLRDGGWQTRHLSIGGASGSRWEGGRTRPLAWQDDGCSPSEDGAIVASRQIPIPANSVWLFEMTRQEDCG